MANETLITDLVAQQAIDQLKQLDTAMEGTLQQFKNCASELAKGLKVPVEVTGDVDALRTLTNSVMREAQQATQQLTSQLQQQQQVVANTTNTISRQLQAQENLNKAQREAFEQDRQAQQLAHEVLGARTQNYELLARYTAEMKANKEEQKRVNEQEKLGIISTEQAIQKRAALMAAYDKTKVAAQQLSRQLTAENKEANAAAGSYDQLSQRLERLKQAQKQLNEEERNSDRGKALESEIQNLDAHLKDLAADMGEHQRNVGNYAIAAQSMKGTLRELTEEIAQLTMQYEELSDEEKRSDVGVQLRDKITQMTEEAGRYKDTIMDVKQSINASASDTRWFDTMMESGKLMVATFGLAKNAALALGMSEESLQKSMLKVQQAMQAVQALQVIQNTLQKQSNLMKGIAVIQSKALAAAQALEAKAATQATGATVAQTVAQKAFNAVANANPYVLLATAILTVIGLVVSYTAATEDAAAADEAAKQAADERKESMENYASSFGQNAGEMLVKYQSLRDQWNALGNDIAAKRAFLVQHRNDFVEVANAAGMSSDSVRDVASAEKNVIHNTGSVEAAIMRRAKAMAAYAEAVRLTQLKLQELEKAGTYTKMTYHAGNRVNASELKKYGISLTDTQLGKEDPYRYSGFTGAGAVTYRPYRENVGKVELTASQAIAYSNAVNKAAREAAQQAMKDVNKKYDDMITRSLHRAGFSTLGEAYAISQGPIEGGGRSRSTGGGGRSRSTGGGGRSRSTGSGGRSRSTGSRGGGSGGRGGRSTGGTTRTNTEQAKDEEELQEILLEVMIDANKKKTKVVEEFSEEWRKLMKEGLMEQKEKELGENKDKYAKDIAELKKSLKLKKISQAEYDKLVFSFTEAYIARGKAIQQAYGDEVIKVDEDIEKHKEELAHQELEKTQQTYDKEIEQLNQKNADEILKIRQRQQQELTDNRGNLKEIEMLQKQHSFEIERIQLQHAEAVAQKTLETLEKQLKLENLSAEDREEIEKKLQEAKNTLANATLATQQACIDHEVEAEQEAADTVLETETELADKRKELREKWMDEIASGLGSVSELMGTLYDNEISKIEELMDAEKTRYETQVSQIEDLADRGIITTEEAEARKREAEAATARAQEQLEKRKSRLEYKKAIIEKANNVSQTAIATARGVMETIAQFGGTPLGIALAAFVGAMGAVQIASILSQPIKAYAEGTKGHPHEGGLAVVGDAGKSELVMLNGRAWLTPDSPTLVDLPRGAQVLPDANKVDLVQMGSSLFMSLPRNRANGQPIVINDYDALEGRMANNTRVVSKSINHLEDTMTKQMKRQKFNAYIASRI